MQFRVILTLQDHEDVCEFGEIHCVHPKCEKLLQRFELANHLENSCNYREELCCYCEKRIVVVDMMVNYLVIIIFFNDVRSCVLYNRWNDKANLACNNKNYQKLIYITKTAELRLSVEYRSFALGSCVTANCSKRNLMLITRSFVSLLAMERTGTILHTYEARIPIEIHHWPLHWKVWLILYACFTDAVL